MPVVVICVTGILVPDSVLFGGRGGNTGGVFVSASFLGLGGLGGGIIREAKSSCRILYRSRSCAVISFISGLPRARPRKCDASFLKPERSCDSAARPLGGSGLGAAGARGAGASLLGRGVSMGRVVSIE